MDSNKLANGQLSKSQQNKLRKEERKARQDQEKQELIIYRQQLDDLINDPVRNQLPFPASLSKGARKKLHTYAHKLGLDSRSTGKGI